MNNDTQANAEKEEREAKRKARKEERKARGLALKLFVSYAFQNPGAIRTIKENKNIFNSPSDLLEFISDENNPKNSRFAQNTASFIEKKSDDLEQLLTLLKAHPNALKIKIPDKMLDFFSKSDDERNKFQIVGQFAQKVLANSEVTESLASVAIDFDSQKDTINSFSEYLNSESQQGVPPSVATIRFIKDNTEKAQTFMELIEQNSSDIGQIATFLQENAELASALDFPKEGLEVVQFLAENREQIQPAVSMIQNEILKPNLLDTAEDVALFMDKEENRDALKNISDYLSEHESELNSYEGIANFIEHCPQDLHKFSELFGNHTDSIVTLAQIFKEPDNAQYAKMFNLSDKDISSVSETIVNNEKLLQAIAKSANNLLNDDDSAFKLRESITEIATFMDKPENKELINDFATYMQTKKEEGISEPLAFIKYMQENPDNVSEFLNFVATKHADISNIVSFTQTDENKDLAENLGLNGALSVLDENKDKIKPIASLIKEKILDSDQRDELLKSLFDVTEFCTQKENIEFLKQIPSVDFSSVESVESFIDDNYDGAKGFFSFIGDKGEKIANLSQFVESNTAYLKDIGLSDEEIKEITDITSYMKNSKDLKDAAELASQIFEFDDQNKSTRQAITGFVKDENNIKSIQNISQTIQKNGIDPFSLEGIEQLLDNNSKDLKNVLTFIENNHKHLATFGAFVDKNIEYARLFGLNEADAESMKSFLKILQKNPEKIQPAAKFTNNLIGFYENHSICKEISSNAEQISDLIDQMSALDLSDPEAINGMLNNEDFKDTLQKTAGLIKDNSDDIIAFADLYKENSDSINKLTQGIDGAENTVDSVNNVLNFTIDNQEKLKPAANVLCTALEFDKDNPGIREELFALYQGIRPGLEQFKKDCENLPNSASGWVDFVNRNIGFLKKTARWLQREDKEKIGQFIKDNQKEMATLLGTDTSTLNTIADYMVNTPGYINTALDVFTNKYLNNRVTRGGLKVAAWGIDGAVFLYNGIRDIFSDADIKKTDDPNKPLLATADMMKKDQKRAEEKSQNIVSNESLLATADMMKKDKKHAEEKSQNIAQSMKESPKETQVPTQIPLLHNKENFYS